MVFRIIIIKYYNQIKNLYKINYINMKIILINVKINYINVNILHKRPVIIPFMKPEIKRFYLITVMK